MQFLVAIVSVIGICERTFIKEGGVYFIISHVLGYRIGAAVSITYCLGQDGLQYRSHLGLINTPSWTRTLTMLRLISTQL
ncbi:unnamed protein product [Protopolystoma xenopodis]|uniref:Amino acid permease/ SLC12A domain-containing protein n=1 Tax=Protopolystoma xenopodis TaxID=117903 RepID=A0A448XLB1_9PLAT|nr:unnamed protein product [Protopolystoma xenopodis]